MVTILGGIATTAFASRLVSKAELGTYFIFLMVAHLSCAAGEFGISSSAIKFLSSITVESEKERTANTILSMRYGLMVLVLGAQTIVVPLLMRLWPTEEFRSIAWLVIPYTTLLVSYTIGSAVLAGYHLFSVFSVVAVVDGVLRAAFSVMALLFGFGLKGLVYSLIASCLVSCILIWYRLPFRVRLFYERERVMQVVRFGGFIYGSYLVNMGTSRAAEALLATFAGPAAVAIYGNAMRVPALLLRTFDSIRPVVFSYASSQHEENRRASVNLVRVFAGLLAVPAGVVIVLAGVLIPLVFSDRYAACVPVSRMLVFWVVLSMTNYYFVISLLGANRAVTVFALSVVQFIVTVSGHMLLIPRLGEMGAAISMTIVASVAVVMSLYFLVGREMMVGRLVALLRSVLPLLLLLLVVQQSNPHILLGLGHLTIFLVVLLAIGAVKLSDVRTLVNLAFQRREEGDHTRRTENDHSHVIVE